MNNHKKVLEKLEVLTYKRLCVVAQEFSLSKKKVDALIKDFVKAKDTGQTEKVSLAFIITNFEIDSMADLYHMSALVREMQAMDNHIVVCDEDKQCTSSFEHNIRDIKREQERNVPKDIEAFMELSYDAHVAIDHFFAQEQKNDDRERKAFIKKIEREYPDMLDELSDSYRERDYESIARVAHHTLDWYLQENPFTTYRKTPQRVAAIAINIMLRFNEDFADHYDVIHKQHLVTLGGWKSPSSLESSTTRAYADVCEGVEDPSLLFINQDNAKEGWRDTFDAWFGYEEIVDYDEYMPAIRLKYFSSTDVDEPICIECDKECAVIGATVGTENHAHVQFMCEDCAIAKMYRDYDFATHVIEYSQRRRMFDVTHLLTEILIDTYLVQNKLFSIDFLPKEKMESIVHVSMRVWNDAFTREEKLAIERIKDQKEIEKILQEKTAGIEV